LVADDLYKEKEQMTDMSESSLVLAGDIGGTKTNLGLFRRGKNRPVLKVAETYSSPEAPSLEHIVKIFLTKHQVRVSKACFGIAGPVIGGRVKTTNLPWDISETRMKRKLDLSHVFLINDLTATALAVPLLSSKELFSLNKGKARKEQNIAIMAPGTGLGAGFLIQWDGKCIPISSEGGHVDFAPNSKAELELWRYLRKKYGHVSIERVISGPGLVNIYSWLKDSGRYREPLWLARKFEEMEPAAAISEVGLANRHPLCVEAMNVFVSVLGAVAGNLALTAMTTGGVYLGGGIPPKILPKLQEPLFIQAYKNKGRFEKIVEKIPVKVILNEKTALLGAAQCAFDREN
jgi:glucokinase